MTGVEELADKLRAVIGGTLKVDAASITIDNLRPLRRNYGAAAWAFDATSPAGRGTLILRLEPVNRSSIEAAPQLQAHAHFSAKAKGVPVPRVVAADDSDATLGSPYVILEMPRGETEHSVIVRRLDSAGRHAGGRAQLLRQCALALSRIHRIETAEPEKARQDRLAIYRASLDALADAPAAFEWAYRWLLTHQPPPSPAVVVNGDFRMGNLAVDGMHLTAILGWRYLHVGDACEDLAWFCDRAWRYGAPLTRGAGGLGSIDTFLGAYEEASGTTVDRVRFHWWRVMAALLRGIMNFSEAQIGRTAQVPSMRAAIMGRRICETEWDLLNLIGEGTGK
ncbi:phosphotransferase family protein [Mycobacterium bourgelatii]|uniref:Acyl-CoA dehydrogenase n=1 Tax=Mycobacterium bourgelatii TaxID=1273442 RepID=A0A7I9YKE6_MYCBU|nr:phosphotransferase family protein [Mycobacterium bourgelatii]MCV6974632.1 phosphotransferase family protein [Mycobacterium bourgelatii]GFG89099.1 acyl-CoA dehydrogenase [Mycobacterium bourgelatii]